MIVMPIASKLLSSLEDALGSTPANPTPTASQIRADYKALGIALQTGDLGSAQQAFTQLEHDSPKVTQAVNGATGGSGNSFQALASALQTGNLTGAQSAFATMQQAPGTLLWHNFHRLGALGNASTSSSTIAPASASTPG